MRQEFLGQYLERLGLEHPGAPTAAALRRLHRAHVERVPFETLDFQLRRPTASDPQYSLERVLGGRGGYCFHLNGAFSRLLGALGYQVTWHRGGVHLDAATPAPGATADHLALSVECEGQRWYVDVGLGDALHEPLPLATGDYRQGPFTYRLEPSGVVPGGWRFTHHAQGSFAGMDFCLELATPRDFVARHRMMSLSPASPFVRIASVYRRDATGVDGLCGCVLSRIDGRGRTKVRELTTPDEWFGAVREIFGLRLDDLDRRERAELWAWLALSHEARKRREAEAAAAAA